MDRTFVSPSGKGWIVQVNGRIITRHRKKAPAVKTARSRARIARSTLYIQKKNGEIENVIDYS